MATIVAVTDEFDDSIRAANTLKKIVGAALCLGLTGIGESLVYLGLILACQLFVSVPIIRIKDDFLFIWGVHTDVFEGRATVT